MGSRILNTAFKNTNIQLNTFSTGVRGIPSVIRDNNRNRDMYFYDNYGAFVVLGKSEKSKFWCNYLSKKDYCDKITFVYNSPAGIIYNGTSSWVVDNVQDFENVMDLIRY